jgi:hypothetical protein
MISRIVLLVLFLAWPLSDAGSQAIPGDTRPRIPYAPTVEVRTYSPSSNNAVARFGEMKLSNSFLSFARFPGNMDLKYAGLLPPNSEYAARSAYRVLNAETYFRESNICGAPIRWVALEFRIVPLTNSVQTMGFGGSISLSTSESLAQFASGSCSSSVFWRFE